MLKKVLHLLFKKGHSSRRSSHPMSALKFPFNFTNKTGWAYIHDVLMAFISIPLALLLRVGEGIIYYEPSHILKHALVYGFLSAGVFLWAGIYRGVWRYTSLSDLTNIALSVSYTTLLYFPLVIIMSHSAAVPQSLIIINWLVSLTLISGARVIYRVLCDAKARREVLLQATRPIRVCVVGINDQTEMFVREVKRSSLPRYQVVGLIDDNRRRIGRNLHGIEIIGALENIREVVDKLVHKRLMPEMLILADPLMKGEDVQSILDENDLSDIALTRLPNPREMAKSLGAGFNIKPITIEGLLGRHHSPVDHAKIREFVQGKRVAVLGAGSFIGREVMKQIADYSPGHLMLLEFCEHTLADAQEDLAELHPHLSTSQFLVNLSDRNRFEALMKAKKPDIVIQIPQNQNVPLSEFNPLEVIQSVVMGTKVVAETCQNVGIKSHVFISSQQVHRRGSILGATLRAAETILQMFNITQHNNPLTTRFVCVRTGNILGAPGSVVKAFESQIRTGGPLCITHPDMKRHFITVTEAVERVLQSAAVGMTMDLSQGQIFNLDILETTRIVELAQKMIELSGLVLDVDIRIEFTGLRPGESLEDEFIASHEVSVSTNVNGVRVVTPALPAEGDLLTALREIERELKTGSREKIIDFLRVLAPQYKPANDEIWVKFKQMASKVAG